MCVFPAPGGKSAHPRKERVTHLGALTGHELYLAHMSIASLVELQQTSYTETTIDIVTKGVFRRKYRRPLA